MEICTMQRALGCSVQCSEKVYSVQCAEHGKAKQRSSGYMEIWGMCVYGEGKCCPK